MYIEYSECCRIIDSTTWPGHPTNRPAALLPEIIGALHGCMGVWLPYVESWLIARHVSMAVAFEEYLPELLPRVYRLAGIDALYFGTPTIVDNAALFKAPAVVGGRPIEDWNKEYERSTVHTLVSVAKAAGLKRVVCGLGSGDISVEERLEDMGPGAEVLAWKKFDEFEDWVIAKEIT